MMGRITIVAFTAMLLGLLFPPGASAQLGYHAKKHIHINGQHLSDEQVATLERTLGYAVPSGFYLVDWDRGVWGYEGNKEVLGQIRPAGVAPGLSGTPGQPQGGGTASSRRNRPVIRTDSNSSYVGGKKCSYMSVGGTTVKYCN